MTDGKNICAPLRFWTHATGSKRRVEHVNIPTHASVFPSQEVEPPMKLGRFDCRGRYVWPGIDWQDDVK